MSRFGRHSCPVPGCGGVRLHWQAVCGLCWRLLPRDIRSAIVAARELKAWQRVAQEQDRAARWLAEHAPAAKARRRVGGG